MNNKWSIEEICFILDNIDKGLYFISSKILRSKKQLLNIIRHLKKHNKNIYYNNLVIKNNLIDKIKQLPETKNGVSLCIEDEKIRKTTISKTMKNNPECGGLRKGSGRGKKGSYKGYWCDSSYELAFVIYCLEHDIKIKRNWEKFPYIYEEKIHYYIPDFICEDKYIEIKGYMDEKMKIKIKNFPYELKVLLEKDLKTEIEYAIFKYGKNYIELYEDKNFKLKKCIICDRILCKANQSGLCIDCFKKRNHKKEKKVKIQREYKKTYCTKCGTKIDNRNITKLCIKCYEHPKKFNVSKEELEKMIELNTYTKIGKIFGVTRSNIVKRAKKFGIYKRR